MQEQGRRLHSAHKAPLQHPPICCALKLGGRFRSGEGKGESEAPGGGGVVEKSQGGRGGRRAGRVSAGNSEGGGGPKFFFFSGPKFPLRKELEFQDHFS